jgi:hypothetical protein
MHFRDPFCHITGHTQKNGGVSKVVKNVTSHPTLAQHTLSAAGTVKVLMRYQQFASHAYCGATGQVSKMASKQEKAFCVPRFAVSRSVTIEQREFRARFKKDALHKNNVQETHNKGL